MQSTKKQTGFTIVELLIVIVVIAILAAITIVSYNGIQNRAKSAAAQSAASQAAQKIAAYAAINNDQYPATLSDAGINNSDNSLQYTGGGSAFCVTATQQNISYYQSNTTGLARGACFGHDRDGAPALVNLAANPSLEADTANWSPRWFGSGGAGTTGRTAAAAYCGATGIRKTWTANGSSQDLGYTVNVANMTAGQPYAFSVFMRSSVATAYRAWVGWYNSSGGYISGNANLVSEVAVAANTWRRLTFSEVAPAGASTAAFIFGPYPTSGTPNFTTGSTLDADCVMVTQGSAFPNYADGDTDSWIWSGARYNSTSSGPAQ